VISQNLLHRDDAARVPLPRAINDAHAAAADLFENLIITQPPIGVAHIDSHGWVVLVIGFVVSFIVAYGSVAWFMNWVRRRGFGPFAIYRILLGIAVLFFASRLAN